MQENKNLLKYVAPFFSPLTNGFCTFYEKESGSRTVFIEFLNVKNLDLKKLKTISILFLPGNHIPDITVLSLVENIEYLNLKDNQITDASPLQGLKNLNHLELQNNQITDITPLKELPALKYLDLSCNPVTGSHTIEELKKKMGENFVI
jgi:Leucine-rich repeat (LRR) protein